MSFSNHLDAHSRIVPETRQYQDVRTRTPVPVANLLLGALLTVAIVAVLWLAGEQHRANCLRAGNTSCTVLPWNHGAPRAVSAPAPISCINADRVGRATGHRPPCR